MNKDTKLTLAYKSKKEISIYALIQIILIILCVLSVLYIDVNIILAIMSLIIFTFGIFLFSYVLIKIYKLPNILIYYNNFGIYLNLNKKSDPIFIKYDEIIDCKKLIVYESLYNFKTGTLILQTNKTKYKIISVKSINHVVEFINRKISANKFKL